MGDRIHRSREVYKNIGGGYIVPVSGLYVSDEHTEPWYIDHMLTITGWTSNPTVVHDYTTKEVDASTDHVLNLVGLSIDDVSIHSYTQAEYTLPEDYVLNLLALSFADITSRDYYTTTVDQPDYVLNLLGLTFADMTSQAKSYSQYGMSPEPTIAIVGYSSTPGVIS